MEHKCGIKEIEKMYQNQDYSALLVYYSEYGIHSPDESMILAFALLEIGYFYEALSYMEKINEHMIDLKYRGKFYRYLGLAYYYLNKYKESLESFEKGVLYGDLESELWKKLLFSDVNEVIEVKKIIFRFQSNISSHDKKRIISSAISTYKKMENFFEINIKKRIDIYIYDQPIDVLGNRLSYTDNGMKIIHMYKNDCISHEIVHLFANSLHIPMNRNSFIDEGIATFLSSDLDYMKYKKTHYNKFIQFDLIETWKNDINELSLKVRDGYYYVAGALVGFLINAYGKQNFLNFIKDESYKNAEKIFGDDLINQLKIFMKDIGFNIISNIH